MKAHKFLVCPNCGNGEKFKIFTSNYQIVKQSPETGLRVAESGVLPNLRQTDNYIECQVCFKKAGYDVALDLGKKYVKII